jgi:hypothetical protein
VCRAIRRRAGGHYQHGSYGRLLSSFGRHGIVAHLAWIRKESPVPADTITARFNASRPHVLSAERDADDIDVTTWPGGNRHVRSPTRSLALEATGKH